MTRDIPKSPASFVIRKLGGGFRPSAAKAMIIFE